MHGPGWSLWELRGTGVGAEAYLAGRPAAGRLRIVCSNPSSTTRRLLVGESVHSGGPGDRVHTVTLRPGTSRTVRLRPARHGWYDIAVVDRDDPLFLRRMTGRTPHDRPGVTDPATGTPPALTATLTTPGTPFTQGSPADVVVTLRNHTGSRFEDLSAALSAPSGWTVERTGTAPSALAAGASADVRLTVAPSRDATAGRLVAVAHARGAGLLRLADARLLTRVAPA
ncbi:NEW3 domain-containing protein [Streptomyces griseoflavus]|uniref:COG1470 family protein n=1 Tax=Streptomyces griseoflavus TaxID=35619 RepID=UPI003D7151E4